MEYHSGRTTYLQPSLATREAKPILDELQAPKILGRETGSISASSGQCSDRSALPWPRPRIFFCARPLRFSGQLARLAALVPVERAGQKSFACQTDLTPYRSLTK